MKTFFSKHRVIIFLAILLAAGFALGRSIYGSPLNMTSRDFPPGPQLLSPVTDNVKLSGKEFLEFKWNFPNQIDTDYFYLRVYKGYETYVKDLIFRQRYSVSELPPKLPASFFQPDQAYTWVLIQVYKDGRRSDPVESPFKIIKK